MFTLKDNFKLVGLKGVLIIKNISSLKKFLVISIYGTTVLRKAFSPLFNHLNGSSLLVDISNCSMSFLNSSQADCSSLSFKRVKVSDLSVDIKETFSTELNTYVLINCHLNKMFPLTTFAFCLFLLFIIGHWVFENCNWYKSDLEMAKIEQRLIKYYSLDSLSNKLLRKFLNRESNQQDCCNKKCCKSCQTICCNNLKINMI